MSSVPDNGPTIVAAMVSYTSTGEEALPADDIASSGQ